MKQITCPHCADTYPDFDVAHVCSKGPYAPKLKPRMNKRIQELAEQAREYATTRHPVSNITLSVNSDLFEQKFAELIVQKCADIGEQYADGNYEVRNQILSHFGLEEE
jgi:hypothetical protein